MQIIITGGTGLIGQALSASLTADNHQVTVLSRLPGRASTVPDGVRVRAIRFLIENDVAQGPFNMTAPRPVTNAQFSRTLGRVMKRPAFLHVPAFALRLVLGELSTVVIDGQQVVPSNTNCRFKDREFWCPHGGLAKHGG